MNRIEIVDEIDFILRNSDVIGTINWTVLWHDLSIPILDRTEIIFIYFPGFFSYIIDFFVSYSLSALFDEYHMPSILTASSLPCLALRLRYSWLYDENLANSLNGSSLSFSSNSYEIGEG